MEYLVWLALGSVAVALALSPASAAEADGQAILKALRPGHPRLFITSESLENLRKAVQADPAMKDMLAKLTAQADKILDEPPVEHKLLGPRLLDKSRRCLDRVSTLALVYRLGGDEKYAARALKEMEAAAAFPDWNPSHFLDTAEMSCALGIGYDWLYAYMNAGQRAAIRQALVEKGLTPGLESYRGTGKFGWWTRSQHNWSQVCNGGLAVGALAIADEQPVPCAEILVSGLKAVRPAMANFGPDGSWNEGPGYWGYTLQYTSFYLAALQSALGLMAGLDETPGLAEAGLFRIAFIGPTGKVFNFADAGDGAGSAPSMLWLARTFKKPVCAWDERQRMRPSPFDLIWFEAEGQGPAASGLPLLKLFRRDHVVFFRSAWEDPNGLWIGFKGGDNAANHSHLDLGSFVIDALGQRWALDLGSDDYNLPGYFGDKRWTYYRLRTESHNTLLISGANQSPKAKAPVVAFSAAGGEGRAVADLSQGYPMVRSALRGVAMIGGKRIVIQDEVEADVPVEVVWGMMTRAKIKWSGSRAILEQKGKRLQVDILAPDDAVFSTVSASAPTPQAQQPDMARLLIRLPEKQKISAFAVSIAAEADAAGEPPKVVPLRRWPGWAK